MKDKLITRQVLKEALLVCSESLFCSARRGSAVHSGLCVLTMRPISIGQEDSLKLVVAIRPTCPISPDLLDGWVFGLTTRVGDSVARYQAATSNLSGEAHFVEPVEAGAECWLTLCTQTAAEVLEAFLAKPPAKHPRLEPRDQIGELLGERRGGDPATVVSPSSESERNPIFATAFASAKSDSRAPTPKSTVRSLDVKDSGLEVAELVQESDGKVTLRARCKSGDTSFARAKFHFTATLGTIKEEGEVELQWNESAYCCEVACSLAVPFEAEVAFERIQPPQSAP